MLYNLIMSTNPNTKSRRVTIFGGSGFIGGHLVKKLCRRGYKVRLAISREHARLSTAYQDPAVEFFSCTLQDMDSIKAALTDADVVVNLIGILNPSANRSFAESHVEWPDAIAAAAAQMKREIKPHIIHLSSTAASADAKSEYLRSKYHGEEKIRAFADHTILRAAMVAGPDSSFFLMMRKILRRSPILLLPTGTAMLQPIVIEDLRDLIMRLIQHPQEFRGRTLIAAGPEVISMSLYVRTIAAYQPHYPRLIFPIGVKKSTALARFMQRLMSHPPMTEDTCFMAYAQVACPPEKNDALKILGPLITLSEQRYMREALPS